MKISIVVTVLNEEHTIKRLLESLTQQTKRADEIIIVDGGSKDSTIELINTFSGIICLGKKGNRSVGRNFGIKHANTEWIAITDAGCIPQLNWLEELILAQELQQKPVIAGYYEGIAENEFEEAVIPYALVMPGNVNPENFLPATRSMLLKKSVWQQFGGFDERLSDNEDYAFAKNLEKAGVKIGFAQKAVVAWFPRSDISSFYTMIFRFARGDVAAGIIRPKVVLIFVRYLILLFLIVTLIPSMGFMSTLQILGLLALLYGAWAVAKNVTYVPNGWYFLPFLQLVADIGVMRGSIAGYLQRNSKDFR